MGQETLLDTERLQAYFAASAPELGVMRVLAVDRFANGLSSLTYRLDVETDSGPATWVVRAEPEFGTIPPYDIVWEADLMARVGDAGLPVPGIVHVESDETAMGRRFAVMTYIDGDSYQIADSRFGQGSGLEEQLQAKFVEMLARIHQTREHGLEGFDDARSAARALVHVCRRRLTETEVLPKPLLRHALDVLERNAPDCDQLVLLHGDYRLPNLKWRDGEIVGILDWELARVGDPASDIGFSQIVPAGPCEVRDELLDRYCELTGFTIDPQRVAYYQVLELLKSSIIGLAGAHDLVSGGTDLRLMSVAGLASSAEAVVPMLEGQLEVVEG